MIQDIAPHIYDNQFHPRTARKDDLVFFFHDNQTFLKRDHTVYHVEELDPTISLTYLFQIDETAYYLGDIAPAESVATSLRIFRQYEPKEIGFAGITANQLSVWYQENQFCGNCGSPMVQDDKERAMRCPTCGHLIYPRINPAVIVAIQNDRNELLVTKYATGSYQKYALVAGYTEIGETIEQTVVREVKEETGLDVTDLKYYKSQPWSFSSSLLFGFTARVHGDYTLHLQEDELRLGEWKTRDDEIDSMDNSSLTTEMIQMFKKGEF